MEEKNYQQETVEKLKNIILGTATADVPEFTGWDFVKSQAKLSLSKEEGGIMDYKIFTTLLDTGKTVTDENWKEYVSPAIAFKYAKTEKVAKFAVVKTMDNDHGHEHEEKVYVGFDELDARVPSDQEVFIVAELISLLKDSLK